MSFFFMMVFVVMVFWRPQEWLVTALYGWPILDIVMGIAAMAFFVEYQEGRIRRTSATIPYLFLGLLFAAAMSHVAHTYFAGLMFTLEETWKLCFYGALLFLVLDRPSRLRTVATVFVVMACIMCVHALMQHRLGYGFAGYRYPPLRIPEYGGRPAHTRTYFFGIFGDPNDMAQMLATCIPFAFALRRRVSLSGKVVGMLLAAFLLVAMTTTHSRGGAMAVLAVAICFIALRLPNRRLPVIFILLAIAVLAVCPFGGRGLDMSARERVVFWGEANWVFKENLLFGVGYRMLGEYISQSRAVHNAFVLCYSELGVFGYWFWFNLIMLGMIGCWRARVALRNTMSEEARYVRSFAGLTIAAMAGFLVSSYFLTRAFVPPLFFLMAIANAVPMAAQRLLPAGHPPLLRVKRDVLVYGSIGAAVSIMYIYVSIILLNKGIYG